VNLVSKGSWTCFRSSFQPFEPQALFVGSLGSVSNRSKKKRSLEHFSEPSENQNDRAVQNNTTTMNFTHLFIDCSLRTVLPSYRKTSLLPARSAGRAVKRFCFCLCLIKITSVHASTSSRASTKSCTLHRAPARNLQRRNPILPFTIPLQCQASKTRLTTSLRARQPS